MKFLFSIISTFLVVTTVGMPAYDMSIAGTYVNELGSQMYIEAVSPKMPLINGWYNSTIGYAKGTYPLIGMLTPLSLNRKNNTDISVVSFSVIWSNEILDSNSITTWIGTFHRATKTIYTFWILQTSTESTRGNNTFKKE